MYNFRHSPTQQQPSNLCPPSSCQPSSIAATAFQRSISSLGAQSPDLGVKAPPAGHRPAQEDAQFHKSDFAKRKAHSYKAAAAVVHNFFFSSFLIAYPYFCPSYSFQS
ncbi:unnamed protein product [Cuscuta epithymum]|uniref:Uncharacterized protein n=1 Tax=Cuscuta epithymum TaxID=186058 RepID=A0AAV0CD17_9ASTE|nr:unnamed protein product [Cuscuta epithymum]